MQTILDTLRDILGVPEFYRQLGTSSSYTWDYGAMLEYSIAGIVLCIVIVSAFKFLRALIK